MLCTWGIVFGVMLAVILNSISSTMFENHNNLCFPSHDMDIVQEFSIRSKRKNSGSVTVGPQPLKVCMVTFITKDILSYAKYSLLLNGFYASLHHYDFFVVESETAGHMELDPYDARWNKVKILHYAVSNINSWASHCDFVLWIDADWTVLDLNWDIAGLVSSNPGAHIITSAGKHQT